MKFSTAYHTICAAGPQRQFRLGSMGLRRQGVPARTAAALEGRSGGLRRLDAGCGVAPELPRAPGAVAPGVERRAGLSGLGRSRAEQSLVCPCGCAWRGRSGFLDGVWSTNSVVNLRVRRRLEDDLSSKLNIEWSARRNTRRSAGLLTKGGAGDAGGWVTGIEYVEKVE